MYQKFRLLLSCCCASHNTQFSFSGPVSLTSQSTREKKEGKGEGTPPLWKEWPGSCPYHSGSDPIGQNFVVCRIQNFAICHIQNLVICHIQNFAICPIQNFVTCPIQNFVICHIQPQERLGNVVFSYRNVCSTEKYYNFLRRGRRDWGEN